MRVIRTLSISIGSLLVFVLAACSAGNISVPNAASQSSARSAPRSVAVFGDSEGAVKQRIAEAQAAGLAPRYVTVSAPKRGYVFSVYAQMLRTPNTVLVRAYGRIYVFPATSVKVFYSASPAVDIAPSLPSVSASRFDALAASGATPGSFQFGDASAKRAACPDCVGLMAGNVGALAARWNGLNDAWQVSPDYVAWAPQPKTPMSLPINNCFAGSSSFCNCSGHGCQPGGGGYFPPIYRYHIGIGGGGAGGGGVDAPWRWGTQGTCSAGFLSFSDGCEDDSLSFALGFATWFNPWSWSAGDYVIKFDTDHYWKKHLACYLTHSTSDQWASTASQDFFNNVWSFGKQPALHQARDYTYAYTDGGVSYQTTYRVYTLIAGGAFSASLFDVTTAFIRTYKNCPGY